MAVRMQSLCDPHLSQDVEVEGAAYVIKVGTVERQVDLCADDYDLLLKPVLTLMEDHGRKLDPAGGVKIKYSKTSDGGGRGGLCPVNGCVPVGKEYVNLSTHMRGIHGKSITQWRMETGQLDGKEPAFLCPVAGCGRVFARTQSLGAHMSRAHDGASINDFPRDVLAVPGALAPSGGPKPKTPGRRGRPRKTVAAKR